jgi:hypothetical protein
MHGVWDMQGDFPRQGRWEVVRWRRRPRLLCSFRIDVRPGRGNPVMHPSWFPRTISAARTGAVSRGNSVSSSVAAIPDPPFPRPLHLHRWIFFRHGMEPWTLISSNFAIFSFPFHQSAVLFAAFCHDPIDENFNDNSYTDFETSAEMDHAKP